MLQFLENNAGTIVVGIILLLVVAIVIRKLYRDKKQGKSSCGCGCENCASAGMCHKK